MEEIDSSDKVKQKLKLLSEGDAVLAIHELRRDERKMILNFARYFVGILDRYLRKRPSVSTGPYMNTTFPTQYRPRSRDGSRRRNCHQSDRSTSPSASAGLSTNTDSPSASAGPSTNTDGPSLNNPIKMKASAIIRKDQKVADLLAEINANEFDISSAAEELRKNGDKQWVKIGSSRILLPLALHKRWTRNEFESPYGSMCKRSLDFLTEMVSIYYKTGQVRPPLLFLT